MRKCGECTVCCNVFPLPALGKPAGQWCRNIGTGGCTVHDLGLPEVCGLYACYWLEHEALPDEWRPDRVGLVFTESGRVSVGGHLLPVLVVNLFASGADRTPAGRAAIDRFLAEGKALLLLSGPDMRIEYDRARYAGITAAEIEEAFRRERSRDAEELKRLGAVDEGFRPSGGA